MQRYQHVSQQQKERMRSLTLVISAASTALLPADILHLRDGPRHRGAAPSEDEHT